MGFQCKDGYGLCRAWFTTTVNLTPWDRALLHACFLLHDCLIRHSHTRSCVRVSNQFVPVAHLAALGWPAYKVSGSPDAPRACACAAHVLLALTRHACHTRSVEQYACGYSSQSHILCAGPYNTAYVSVSTTRVYRCEPGIHC